MRKEIKLSLLALVCFGVGTPAIAQQGQFYFPAQDQSQEQQAKDVAECQAWATTQTNYNPAYPPPPPVGYIPPVETGADGSVVRGAARGAAVGAVAGGVGGNKAGKGAAAGAATGALIGGMKRRQKRRGQPVQ